LTTKASEVASGLALPKSMLRWVGLGLVLSSAIVIVISLSSGVTLSTLAQLGYLEFSLAAIVSAARLLVQVLRFQTIVAGFAGHLMPDMEGSATARIGSEFVALSTPASIGGEFVRAAWLSGKGMVGGRALWIGYFEVLIDVYVGSALAILAAALAFSRGAVAIGLTIGAIASVLILAYSVIFLIPALRGIPAFPRRLFNLMERLVGASRAGRFEAAVQRGSMNFSLATRALLRKDAFPVVLKVVGLTAIQAVLSGVALWIVLTDAGLRIDLFASILVAYGAMAVAAIPVSIGGSGLTELAVQSYLTSVFGFSSWAAIVFWRIASFQVVLAISGLAFLLLVHKGTKHFPKEPKVVAISLAPETIARQLVKR
jgi:uncharacterized membrane protein YbhN (UPF0104 family)